MSEYQTYSVGIDGHFMGSQEMVRRDDGGAVAEAKRMVDGQDIEFWSAGACVIIPIHKSN